MDEGKDTEKQTHDTQMNNPTVTSTQIVFLYFEFYATTTEHG